MGLLIAKPNVKRSGIRRRCPRTKKVLRQNGFALGFHAQSIRERERERERNKKAPSHRVEKDRKEKV